MLLTSVFLKYNVMKRFQICHFDNKQMIAWKFSKQASIYI